MNAKPSGFDAKNGPVVEQSIKKAALFLEPLFAKLLKSLTWQYLLSLSLLGLDCLLFSYASKTRGW